MQHEQTPASRVQRNLAATVTNMERAFEVMNSTNDRKLKQTLQDKNTRREAAVETMGRIPPAGGTAR